MDTLLKDVLYAGRGLRKNLGFATVATLTIALGIGACTAIFSVVNAVLLRPLPYSNAQRLVIVWGELRGRNVQDWPFAPPDFRDLRLQSTNTFEDFAGVTPAGRTPISESTGEPEQIRVAGATPNIFRLLGARIIAGRDFIEDDAIPQPPAPPGQPPQQGQPPPQRLPQIAIISHGLWTRRYGSDPGIVGRFVDLGGGRAQIVGVLGPEFELLFPPRVNMDRVPDMWTAARINYETANRNNVVFRVVGRLRPGVTIEQANAQAERVASDLREHFAIKKTSGLYFHVVPMFDDLVSGVQPAILSLMGAVGFVLLIACANVANLLVVRASARGRPPRGRAARGARPRARGARGDRREPRTTRASDARGESRDCGDGHGAGSRIRARGHSVADRDRPQGSPSPRRRADGPCRPHVCRARRHHHGHPVRHRARVARVARRRDGRAA
jgi:putative ABC transport system permease protein